VWDINFLKILQYDIFFTSFVVKTVHFFYE